MGIDLGEGEERTQSCPLLGRAMMMSCFDFSYDAFTKLVKFQTILKI